VDFLGRFFEAGKTSRKTNLLAMFILEMSWRAEMAIGTDSSIFNPEVKRWMKNGAGIMPASVLMVAKPSEVALGCIILSLAYQGKVCYPVGMEYSSRIRAGAISNVVKELHEQLTIETHMPRPTAVVKKYSHRRFRYIGAFKPPTFRELVDHNAFGGTELAGIYDNKPSKSDV